MMSYRTGNEAKLYYGEAGTAPTDVIGKVTSVKINASRNVAKISVREDDVELNLYGNQTISLDIEMPWNSSDPGMLAIREAYLEKGLIALKAIDAEDGKGVTGDWIISQFDHDQPLNEGQKVTIKAEPGDGINRVTLI